MLVRTEHVDAARVDMENGSRDEESVVRLREQEHEGRKLGLWRRVDMVARGASTADETGGRRCVAVRIERIKWAELR